MRGGDKAVRNGNQGQWVRSNQNEIKRVHKARKVAFFFVFLTTQKKNHAERSKLLVRSALLYEGKGGSLLITTKVEPYEDSVLSPELSPLIQVSNSGQ